MDDFLADCPILFLWPIRDRQQNELHAGAQRDGQDIGHWGGGIGPGYGTGAGAGQTDGYGRDGDIVHEDIPQGEGQGYMEPVVPQGGG